MYTTVKITWRSTIKYPTRKCIDIQRDKSIQTFSKFYVQPVFSEKKHEVSQNRYAASVAFIQAKYKKKNA